jgi:hypothetical protein
MDFKGVYMKLSVATSLLLLFLKEVRGNRREQGQCMEGSREHSFVADGELTFLFDMCNVSAYSDLGK